jgi:hypothetical protein
MSGVSGKASMPERTVSMVKGTEREDMAEGWEEDMVWPYGGRLEVDTGKQVSKRVVL